MRAGGSFMGRARPRAPNVLGFLFLELSGDAHEDREHDLPASTMCAAMMYQMYSG
jgi:hypothetical protein